MSKETMYRQCKLHKQVGQTHLTRTTWAEEKYAVQGREVKIEEHDGTWTQDWTVIEVYKQLLDEKSMQVMRHAHTRQRKASDI